MTVTSVRVRQLGDVDGAFDKLRQRREDLLEEERRLYRDIAALGPGHEHECGEKGRRVREVQAELTHLNPVFKAQRRSAGRLVAEQMQAEGSDYQKVQAPALEAVDRQLGPWVQLESATREAQGKGAALPLLPAFATRELAELGGWLRLLVDVGLAPDSVPARLRPLLAGDVR